MLKRKVRNIVFSVFVVVSVILSMVNPMVVLAGSDNGKLTSGSVKSETVNNPVVDHKFGADPCAMTYNGRVYIYMTNDTQQYDGTAKNGNGHPTASNDYGKIATISIISSDDMVNWVDHGEVEVSKIAKWARNSWAPTACYKKINGKDKFFLYFADNGSGIGVLEADSPVGPFREPATGSRLIQRGSQAADGVVWLFDPAVFVDSDGNGYMYYGGGIPGGNYPSQQQKNYPGTARVVKLASNMVQTSGNAVKIDAPGIFEDSGIHKANGRYYYTYCSNFNNNLSMTGNGNICVMESNNPMGPFTFVGKVFDNPYSYFGIGGNNHHSFFEFNGKTYLTYHAQTVTKALGIPSNAQGYRSTHINEVSYDGSGHIKSVKGTYVGAAQVKNLNPYVRTEAETIAWSKGVTTEYTWQPGTIASSVNMKVTQIHNGDYIAVSNADLGSGLQSIAICASPINGGKVEIRLDGRYGTKIGEVSITGAQDSWKEFTTNLSSVTGVHDIYFVFTGGSGQLFYLDYWKMAKSGATTPETPTVPETPVVPETPSGSSGNELVSNADIEAGTANWEGLYGCNLGLGYVTVHSGSLSLKASNRTITAHGPVQNVTGKLECGKTYDVSAAVRYNMSENAQATGETTFFVSVIYGDGSIQNMATAKTRADQWATLKGSYTVPSNADLSNVRVFVETEYKSEPTAQDLVTFFVDDVSIKATSGSNNEVVIPPVQEETTTPSQPSEDENTNTPSQPEEDNNEVVTGGILADGWYYIKSPYAQKYLQADDNLAGNNVNVEIGTGTGVQGQKWYVTNTSDGYVTLKNGHGYMLDVYYGKNEDGTNIQTHAANGEDAQKFKIMETSQAGVYGITTKISSDARALDIYNWSKEDGTNVCQWTYFAAENQMWQFEACNN